MQINKLILFDIDGTLITSPHDNRFERAIGKQHGVEVKLEGDFQGYTDFLILSALLKKEGWTEIQITEAMPDLLQSLDEAHAASFDPISIKIIPGVRELLEALSDKDCTLGLVTGNLDVIAQRKLSAVDLWKFFKLGGYGNDPHSTRSDLVRIAINRAGYSDKKDLVYVIGDTARDIQAAHDAGVTNSIAIHTGSRNLQELIDSGAKKIIHGYEDLGKALKQLGF